jgi:hypothetical protein
VVDGLQATLGREGPVGVRKHRQQWRLMRDERAHVAGVGGHQSQGAHRSTTGGEQFHRSDTERLDDAVDVLGVLLGCPLGAAVTAGAATQAPGVIGEDGAVREVRRERADPLASMG